MTLEKVPNHVLVVEDSIIIAMDAEDSLRELGVEAVTIAESVDGALRSIEHERPDMAILDYSLGDQSCDAAAERLRELGVPFVLATGYSDLELPLQELGAVALLKKPYGKKEIAAALGKMSGA